MADANGCDADLPRLVEALVASCGDGKAVNLEEGNDLPDRVRVDAGLDRLFSILFPGLYSRHPVASSSLPYYLGERMHRFYVDFLREAAQAFRYDCRIRGCTDCDIEGRARSAVMGLMEALPAIRETLKEDIQAAYDGDPAAKSLDAIILSYPCVEAIATYRLAHELYRAGVPLVPRMWTERAHARTGIDINPGATIGPRFFIDHGTGVVIGETCEIGRNVALYQGVTLGALAPAKGQSLRGTKRHPTIEDDVIIYAGATILGGETVIGRGAVVGGNVWLTHSVAPGTKVLMGKTDLLFLDRRDGRRASPPGEFDCPAKALCRRDGTADEEAGPAS